MRVLYILLCIVLLHFGCSSDDTIIDQDEKELMDGILSASVAFTHSDQRIQDFLANPTEAYVSCFFQFPDDLANDIIFGLDMEWIEGVDNPIHVSGGDWMSFAGITREGILWFPIGAPENLLGTPTEPNLWEIHDLNIDLAPNVWYKMTIFADFNKREFISFRLEGNGLDDTQDISGFPLVYPNYIPFDKPSITYYTHASRSKDFAPDNTGGTKVYFDDMEGGILVGDTFETIFSNGFEDQTQITDIPVSLPVIPLSGVTENLFYYENSEAKLQFTSTVSRTGNQSMVCDASLVKD
ncbi:hypothetical protein [Maribacter sp. HTCC2170]|uniref:hypothetical protein n=1 Tax=Maribacter sp. (strain HTCC2170 / KCCM 42371) TaxID=313603 RepID=UPI00006B4817|nr:hypothetical protein [Maribacter sp. HTCC2170]EAR01964.1 hypothetical protein FB2170_15588 [Maribacter sp. HTCC2170]